MPAVAVTDHGNMSGILDFYKKANKEGIKPILGCLLKGQEIYTVDGIKPIEEIVIGDLVLTHKGRFKKVTKTFQHQYQGELYTICSNSRGGAISLTEEHPVLVREYGVTKWITPPNILPGRPGKTGGTKYWNSYFCLPKLVQTEKQIDVSKYLPNYLGFISKNKVKKIKKFNKHDSLNTNWKLNRYWKITKDLAYFLGLYTAEGSVNFSSKRQVLNGEINFTFNIREKKYSDFIVNYLYKKFGIQSKVYIRPNRGTREVVFCHVPLAYILSGLCGKGARNKKIPTEILLAKRDRKRDYLTGLLDGDGRSTKENPNLKVASKTLIWQTRLLYADVYNRISKVVEITEGRIPTGTKETYQSFILSLTNKKSYTRALSDKSFSYKPIKNISHKQYSGTVYNFEVEEDNSYVSDFILHNCEAYFTPDNQIKAPSAPMWHLVLLAKNELGFRNLLKLSSYANTEGFYKKPRVDRRLLSTYHEGLIVLSACIQGEVPKSILSGKSGAIEASWYKGLFGPDFYLEIQKHGKNNEELPDQQIVNDGIMKLSRDLDIPLVATCDVHCLDRGDGRKRVLLKSIAYQQDKSEAEEKYKDVLWFKSPDELDEYFVTEEEKQACANTVKIAEQIEKYDIGVGKVFMPQWKSPDNEDTNTAFLRRVHEGLAKTLKRVYNWDEIPKEYSDRLEYEIEVITKMGFIGYFLILADIMEHLDREGVPRGPGRGSSAGSLVVYSLGITKVDPIKYGLLFERFINLGRRHSLPDVDSDSSGRYKEQLLDYFTKEFGVENIAQIGTFTKFKTKSSMRDICRDHNLTAEKTNKIMALLPDEKRGGQGDNAITFNKVLESPEVRAAISSDKDTREAFDDARAIEGLYRQMSAHACGVVISDHNVSNHVPLAHVGSTKLPVTQWDMKGIEEVGLVKFDFLSLKTLDVLSKALGLIEKIHGVKIDIDALPDGDELTYKLLCEGKTTGIFQLSESGMTEFTTRFQPKSIEDLSMITALYRPGPMDSGWHEEVANIRQGIKEAEYPIKEIEHLLKPTYGAMVYQEQVMAIAQRMAGFSLSEADNLRKAMGKKLPEEMEKQRKSFVEGSVKQGFEQSIANEMFNAIFKFSNYGFVKSHAVSYSIISYQTAYLKAHYPAEFLAACISFEEESEEMPYWFAACKEMGLTVRSPHINYSQAECTVEDDKTIRLGLNVVKGLSTDSITRIGREISISPFVSLEDLIERVSLCNAKCLRTLIDSGTVDGLGLNRSQMRFLAEEYQNAHKDTQASQLSLFDKPKIFVPDIPDNQDLNLRLEYETVGFYLSQHPLDMYGVQDSINSMTPETRSLDVIISSIRLLSTKKDRKPFASIILSDRSGTIEAVVFPRDYEKIKDQIVQGRVVRCLGNMNEREGKKQFVVTHITPMETIQERECQGLIVFDIPVQKMLELKNYMSSKGIPIVLDVHGVNLPIGCLPTLNDAKKVLAILQIQYITIGQCKN